ALREYFTYKRLIVVAAFTRRHDFMAMLARLAPVVDHLVLTTFTMYADFGPGQAMPPDEIAMQYAAMKPRGTWSIEADPLAAAAAMAQPDALICVTGSLYLVGTVREPLLQGHLSGSGEL